MSNKQRTSNLRAIPDPDKADLTPAEKGAETKKKNAEIAAKKDQAGRQLRLSQHLDKMDCPYCFNKAKDIRWLVWKTEGNLRYVKCSHCPNVEKVVVE